MILCLYMILCILRAYDLVIRCVYEHLNFEVTKLIFELFMFFLATKIVIGSPSMAAQDGILHIPPVTDGCKFKRANTEREVFC